MDVSERPVVLLVPGFSGQDLLYWNVMHHRFERDGFRVFTTTFPRLSMQDMRVSAAKLGERIDEIEHATGAPTVHTMGHSMGGLIMRYYADVLDGAGRVASMVTVGTPHQGTYLGLAGYATAAGRQLLPGSDFLRELDDAHRNGGARVPLLNLYGTHDFIIVPPSHAMLPGGVNERIRVAGHWTLLIRSAVYKRARRWFQDHPRPVAAPVDARRA